MENKKIENITVDNLKCGGCENTIKKTLKQIEGVEKVAIDNEKHLIEVTHQDSVSRLMLTDSLKKMGYPEMGTTEGLNAVLSNAKSYISCAMGRLGTEEEEDLTEKGR
jgi:copper chaperone